MKATTITIATVFFMALASFAFAQDINTDVNTTTTQSSSDATGNSLINTNPNSGAGEAAGENALGDTRLNGRSGSGFSADEAAGENALGDQMIGTRTGMANLYAIHGISGLGPVDVYVDDAYQFTFDFNQGAGPLALPADTYDVEVRQGTTTLLQADITLEDGGNYTAIANYVADEQGGAPGVALNLFENNTTPLMSYNSVRVTLRHTADAPAVDIGLVRGFFGGRMFVKPLDLSNFETPSQFGEIDTGFGFWRAKFFVAGTNVEAFDSGRLFLPRGFSYIIYAIGSINDGSFTLFVQAIDV